MNLNDAQILAKLWMEHHGLRGWKFQFDNAKRRFGCCYPFRRLITLSHHLVALNDEPEVEDVILHEIAHALSPHDGHGSDWKRTAAAIGARPDRCYNTARVNTVPEDWIGECLVCRQFVTTFKPRKNWGCGHCSAKYRQMNKLIWRRVTPPGVEQ